MVERGAWNKPYFLYGDFKVTYYPFKEFKPIYVDMNLHLDGGTCAVSSVKARLGGMYKFPEVKKDGYYVEGWYSDSGFTNELTEETIVTYSINDMYVKWVDKPVQSIKVNLNDQWQTPTQWTNTNANFDVYESNSNYNTNNSYAKMYITVEGFTEFTIYINSYAESSYDYTLAFIVGYDPTSLPSGSSVTGNVAGTTYGYQYNPSENAITSGTGWKAVTYQLDGSEATICVCYRKDQSVNSNWDRGYVAIPRIQN